MDRSEYQLAAERRQGMNKAIVDDVQLVFKGKSAGQLAALQIGIEKKLIDKEEGTDIGYWESLLSELKAHLARARLRDKHRENLTTKLEMLKAEQTMEEQICGKNETTIAKSADSSVRNSPLPLPSKESTEDEDETAGGLLQYPKRKREEDQEEVEDTPKQEYINGGYSPKYILE